MIELGLVSPEDARTLKAAGASAICSDITLTKMAKRLIIH